MSEPTKPKFRPVFGTKSIELVSPLTPMPQPTSTAKASTTKTSQKKGSTQKRAKHMSLPKYFSSLDPTERILLAYTVFRKPEDWGMSDFYTYTSDNFSYLDKDLPGLDYHEVTRLLTQWTKAGILTSGRSYNSYSLNDGVSEPYWKWLRNQAPPDNFDFKLEKIYPSFLSDSLDNLLNFLVMVDQGEVLLTRAREINKHSMKRILTSLTMPVGQAEYFNPESYFNWLLSMAQFLQLIGSRGDRMVLTTAGRDLPESLQVEELLCRIFPTHFDSIPLKGFYLILPLLDRCTEWTSWAHMVDTFIPGEHVGNLVRLDRVISILDPLRFLGLLEWGECEGDILVRATALGQYLFPKLLRGDDLRRLGPEIKILTDQVYPMNGPDTAYVQPNFEILVPRSASWTVRWALGQFAVLEQQDQMLKYRLDTTYLMNALKRGMPAEDVIKLLTKLSPYPLPENLVITIQQWVESFGTTKFLELSLLECSTPEQAASIASARKYREYVFGLYSPTAVIVREPEKLRKLLEKQGIYPLPGILGGEEVARGGQQ